MLFRSSVVGPQAALGTVEGLRLSDVAFHHGSETEGGLSGLWRGSLGSITEIDMQWR